MEARGAVKDCVSVKINLPHLSREELFDAGFKAGFMRAVAMIGTPEQQAMADAWFAGDDSLVELVDGKLRFRAHG